MDWMGRGKKVKPGSRVFDLSNVVNGRTVERGKLGEETGLELDELSTLLWGTASCIHSSHTPSLRP